MILPAFFSFSAGLVVMLISAQIFLNLTKELSVKWRFSPLFISIVIVALGTNLPELTVTLAALTNSDPGLAMGNIVGSSIANITIVLGTATLFGKVRIGTNKTQKNAIILLLITFLFSILSLSAVRTTYKIAILLITLGSSLSYQYVLAVRGRLNEDKALLQLIDKLSKKKRKLPIAIYLILFFSSLVGLVIGGNITVTSITEISNVMNVSTTILGLTLTSLATSLPELLLAIISTKKNDNKVVIGTLMGSNIFNLTLFPAIILFATYGYKIQKFISIKEIFFLMLTSVIFYGIIIKKKDKTIEKKLSVLLIALFALFSVTIFYL